MMFVGVEATKLYRLHAMLSAVKLEAQGFRHRRSVTAQAKREFGIKGNRDKVIAELEKQIQIQALQVPDGAIRGD